MTDGRPEVEEVAQQLVSSEVEEVAQQSVSSVVEEVAQQPVSSEVEEVAQQPVSSEVEEVAQQPVSSEVEEVAQQPSRDPETSAVQRFWQGLGLPGLIDLHVHFLPPNIQRAVWAVFDAAGPKIGREWPIRYRSSVADRVALLRDFGVRRFPTHPYAHKPGVAAYLNGWARDFAAEVPEALWSATFFPEPEAASYVDALVAGGVQTFKIHLQVGEFLADDPLLDPVWGTLQDAGTPVVVHAGSGPVGNAFTGPDSVARLLARFPRLCLVIAHLGAPEYDDFLTLAERHPQVRLDTTMVFTDFFDAEAPYPRDLLPRLRDLQDRVLLGSDFPTIPYPYVHQLEALARLDLGEEWLRAVCWHNAAALLGLDATETG